MARLSSTSKCDGIVLDFVLNNILRILGECNIAEHIVLSPVVEPFGKKFQGCLGRSMNGRVS